VNACKDRLRHRSTVARRLSVSKWSKDTEPDPATHLCQSDALRQAFGALSTEQRVVIVLRFLEDLPIEEIAVRCGCRVGTVKSRLHYALRGLRAAYEAAERTGRDPS
jgi:RNA polymerase sigma factor (sigma-70 family)